MVYGTEISSAIIPRHHCLKLTPSDARRTAVCEDFAVAAAVTAH
jgi:hypothetical protein